jgi:hypothetical protein
VTWSRELLSEPPLEALKGPEPHPAVPAAVVRLPVVPAPEPTVVLVPELELELELELFPQAVSGALPQLLPTTPQALLVGTPPEWSP